MVFDIGNRRQKGPLLSAFAEKEIWFVHDVEAMEQYLLEALNVEDRCARFWSGTMTTSRFLHNGISQSFRWTETA